MGGKNLQISDVYGYADSSFNTDHDTARSPGGFIFKWGNSVIMNKSKWFNKVHNSTTETELEALYMASTFAIWVKELLKTFNHTQQCITIHEDNEGAIKYVKSNDRGGRLKHSDRKYLWIREQITENLIDIKYIPTELNIADINTKTIGGMKLQEIRREFNFKTLPTECL
jgi:competence CoiA-like predicted nuclease